jgi:hypothetical protein
MADACTKSQNIKLLSSSISTTQNILTYDLWYSRWKDLYLSSIFMFSINLDTNYRNMNMTSFQPVMLCFKFPLFNNLSVIAPMCLSLSPTCLHIPCCQLQYLTIPNPLFTDYLENKLEISKLHKLNKLSTLNGSTTNQVQHGRDQTMALSSLYS